MPRVDARPPSDPGGAEDGPAAPARLRGRPLATGPSRNDRRHVRHVRAADHLHGRAARSRLSERFTDAHVHFWDHALPGMRWRFLEPDFDHPRLKGTQRLDAPRFGPDELLAEAGTEPPDKVVHIQCALLPAPTPTQETEWLESLAHAPGSRHAMLPGRRLRGAGARR